MGHQVEIGVANTDPPLAYQHQMVTQAAQTTPYTASGAISGSPIERAARATAVALGSVATAVAPVTAKTRVVPAVARAPPASLIGPTAAAVTSAPLAAT